jgi:general secretion pathway protein C
MKQLPILSSFVFFLLLCMSLAFWGMRFYKPPAREVAAPVGTVTLEPVSGQWGGVFGTTQAKSAPSEYQIKGVVIAVPAIESVAIFTVNGGAPNSVGVGQELSPGVTLKEVYPTHIIIEQSGSPRRIDLPASAPIESAPQAYTPQNNPFTQSVPPPVYQPVPVQPPVPIQPDPQTMNRIQTEGSSQQLRRE